MPYKDPAVRRAYLRQYQNRWYQDRRVAWIAANGPCTDCGGSEGLEVDHVDPNQKVSHRVWSWSAARRAVELAKCVVRCRRCHHLKTWVDNIGTAEHGTRRRYKQGCTCLDCRHWGVRRGEVA